jgi:predicted ATPase/DNA-binding SARP family transcriptional activator
VAARTDVRLRATVLGSVQVEGRARTLVEPPGTLAKNLIVALVLGRGAVSVRGLIDDLWNDDPPRNEKAALQTLVSRVRAASADDLLVSASGGYALSTTAEQTDFGLAREHLARARAALAINDFAAAETEAGLGLDLWSGEPGSDLGESPLALQLADAAATLHFDLQSTRATARVELHDNAGALSDLESLVSRAPFDEDLQLLRLRATSAAGRRNDAVRMFGEFKSRLRDELGTSPSPELVAFNTNLLRDDETPKPSSRVTIGLRAAPNELVGRDKDISALGLLITESRLTTIVGAGGLGKTRLAQEVAARAAEKAPAVIVVELASVRSSEDVPIAFATTLGIRDPSGRLNRNDPGVRLDLRDRILTVLAERPTLLIVDNCEHLIDAAAHWVNDILESTSAVRVLATSRAPLAISAERVYQLDSLPTTTDDHTPGPAVTLFLERARAARPSVILPLDVVARLCTKLDGLPLAIELAAARVRSMSVEEIERRLANRFALLKGGDRAAPERHRTLLAVIDWSWNLLGESERRMLRRLSRFPDGFSADAARIVAGDESDFDASDDLDALVSQSLLSVAEDASTGSMRYRMLETVREFGDMALVDAGEDTCVTTGMYDWALSFARTMATKIDGAEQVRTFRLIRSEQDNLVAILRAAIADGRSDVVVVVFAILGYQWSLRGAHSEVVGLARAIVVATTDYTPDESDRELAAVSLAIVGATSLYGEFRVACVAISRVRKWVRGRPLRDGQLNAMVTLVLNIARPGTTVRLVAEYQQSPDPRVACFAHIVGTQVAENAGELDLAIATSHKAYELAVELQDTSSQGMSAHSLAQLYSQSGRPKDTLVWAQRAKEALVALDAKSDLQQLDWLVAANEISLGQFENATRIAEFFASQDQDSLGFDFVDLRSIGWAALGEIASAHGDHDEAARLTLTAADLFDAASQATAPWFFMVSSACIVMSVRAGTPGATTKLVRKSRTRLIVTHRMRPTHMDKPVMGAAILGPAVWLIDPNRNPSDTDIATGLELLILSRALGGRQDLPSLWGSPQLERAGELYGTDRIDALRTAVNDLPMESRALRAIELLRSIRV